MEVLNLSTYRVIPSIFRSGCEKETGDENARAETVRLGQKERAFVLGFVGAIGALGSFLIPRVHKYSIGVTGGPQTALVSFMVFYVTCVALICGTSITGRTPRSPARKGAL